MAKMMICLILIVFLFIPASGLANVGIRDFVFMDVITWDSTINEAVRVLGEDVSRIDEAEDNIGLMTMLTAGEVSAYGYTADVALMFFNGKLCFIEIRYGKEIISDADVIIDALEKKHGPSEVMQENEKSLNDWVCGTQIRARWVLDKNTALAITDYDDTSAQYRCYISIENTEIMDDLNELVFSVIE